MKKPILEQMLIKVVEIISLELFRQQQQTQECITLGELINVSQKGISILSDSQQAHINSCPQCKKKLEGYVKNNV